MSHPFVSSVYSTALAPANDPSAAMAAFMSANPTAAGPSLPPLSHLLPASSGSTATAAAVIDFAAVAAAAAATDGSQLGDVIDLTSVKPEPCVNACSGSYSFVPAAGQKKRPRRKYHEIERLYHCNFEGCSKAYGTLNHLNAHVAMQNHGPKRLPVEFKEMRKQWRKQKREQRATETTAQCSAPSATVSTSPTTTTMTADFTDTLARPVLTTSTPPTTAYPSAAAAAASMMIGMDPESIALSYAAPPPPPGVSDHHPQQHHPATLMISPYMPWQGFVGPTSAVPGSVPATTVLPPY